jgi:primosomal protein N' (replication factor Y)
MYYYEVLPASAAYRSNKPLTYSFDKKLLPGQIVKIDIRNSKKLAVVKIQTKKPIFSSKEISEVYLKIPALPKAQLRLIDWLTNYYASNLGSVVQQFISLSLSKVIYKESSKKLYNSEVHDLPLLTVQQKRILSEITTNKTYLLHGETGSGKTRIYIELAIKSFKKNKSVMMLTPEISLTPQLENSFRKIFGDRVVTIHSSLSDKERALSWLRIINSTEPLVVLGPRSALFSPISNLGLIIIDEEHETSYKQNQPPFYHAIRVASKLRELTNSILILGSATPSVVEYYVAVQKRVPVLRMKELAISNNNVVNDTFIVDLTDKQSFSKSPHLSDLMLLKIEQALAKKEQVLLFLNRRGTARVVLCENCGWRAICPRCDLSLIYHSDSHSIQCHACGYKDSAPTTCPSCHNQQLLFKSIGTKSVTESIEKLFPSARVQRFDTDNKKADRFEQKYKSILSGDVDILIGTQTVAKGLDLPKLGMVGIVVAETSLSIPDFTSGERTYQLLSQVMGRVGRGHRKGVVVIQAYDPTNLILQAAIQKNWEEFYDKEIRERQKFTFPPFCYLLKLTCRRASKINAQRASSKLFDELSSRKSAIQILGPSPSFYEKISDKYQWQLIIKSKNRDELLRIIPMLPGGWTYDIDPINLL